MHIRYIDKCQHDFVSEFYHIFRSIDETHDVDGVEFHAFFLEDKLLQKRDKFPGNLPLVLNHKVEFLEFDLIDLDRSFLGSIRKIIGNVQFGKIHHTAFV